MGTITCVCICVVFSKSWYERETAKGLVTSCVMCLTASQCILYLCSSCGLSCLLGLMYHLHVWGEQTLVTHQLWQRGLLEGQSDTRLDSAFVFVYHRKVSGGNLSAVPSSLPPSLCSSPLPLSSGISGGKAWELWLHCIDRTKVHCEILLLFISIEQEWELLLFPDPMCKTNPPCDTVCMGLNAVIE